MLRVSQRLERCPKEGCGHLLPRDPEGATQGNTGLFCACGGVWCSNCKGKVHWPSTCEQNEKYKEKHKDGGKVECDLAIYGMEQSIIGEKIGQEIFEIFKTHNDL